MKFFLTTIFFSLFTKLIWANDLVIEKAEIRVLPTTNMTAATMVIKNKSTINYKLIKVEADFAKVFELHTMGKVDGVMKMRNLEFIEVPAKSDVELKSGGLHLMIFDLKELLKENAEYKMKLHFEPKKELVIPFKGVAI